MTTNSTNGHKPGFRFPERTDRLVFSHSDWSGAEVVVRRLPFGLYLDYQRRIRESQSNEEVAGLLADLSRDVLCSWNIEDANGQEIPLLPNGLGAIELDYALTIVKEWMRVAANIPLVERSSALSTSSVGGGARRRAKSSTKTRG